jgi:hypothetical protein
MSFLSLSIKLITVLPDNKLVKEEALPFTILFMVEGEASSLVLPVSPCVFL